MRFNCSKTICEYTGKFYISNPNPDVDNTQLKVLFSQFCGLREVGVNLDMFGQSLASAEVIFEDVNEALKVRDPFSS